MQVIEYRADFFVNAIVKMAESVAGLLIIILITNISNGIAGWTPSEVMLINLTFTLTTVLSSFLFISGLQRFSESLNKGNIDRYLYLPVDLQFTSMMSLFDWSQIFRIIASILLIIWVIVKFNISVNIGNIFLYIYLILISTLIMPLFVLIITSSIFWFNRVRNIHLFGVILLEQGKMPTEIFKGLWYIFFSTIIPLLFVATVPVGILTGKYSLYFVSYATLIFIVLFVVSRKVLSLGVKKYTGSSS